MAKSYEEVQQQLVQYAKQLLSLTLEGRVEWKTTDREKRFRFSGVKTGAFIEMSDDVYVPHGKYGYVLSLLNQNEVAVAELESKWTRQFDMDTRSSAWNEDLEELYNAAKRIAYNVDDVLKVAFQELP